MLLPLELEILRYQIEKKDEIRFMKTRSEIKSEREGERDL